MRNLLASLAILAILLGVGFYAAGWLKYDKDDNRATIELETDKIERAAGEAVDEGRRLLDDVIEPDNELPVKEVDPPLDPPVERDDLEGPVTLHTTQAMQPA